MVRTSRTHLQWYEQLQVVGKSSFKQLILSTPPLSRAWYVIMSSLLPSDLKDSEAEWRNTYVRPPIPFVPIKEFVEHSSKPKSMKIEVEAGLQMSYPIWSRGTPDSRSSFVSHPVGIWSHQEKGLL